MKTLLRIDASLRTHGSSSRQLADRFQARWVEANPGGRVVVRDLAQSPVPHLDRATAAAFYGAPSPDGAPPAGLVLSDMLIDELSAADHLLLSSPMYNLTLSSALKAYIDHVVRCGRTFVVEDGRFVGLLGRIAATVVTTRGAIASPARADDFQIAYLRAILGFIGIDRVDRIAADGMAQDETTRTQRLALALAQIDRLFTVAGPAPRDLASGHVRAGDPA